jgi:TatD DNase family protein
MYFDTHAHYDDDAFSADRDALLSALPAAGIGRVLNPGCGVASSRTAVSLAARWAQVYAAVGLHPENCGGCGDVDFDTIRALCAEKKVVAIGEIGLDYYWAENPPRDHQRAVFRRQLAMAEELDLPVIVHDRDAHADCLALVSEFPSLRGVFHCFSGSPEMAEILLRNGWYLGFDGPVTYKNAKKAPEVIALCPMERILLETDSPYLSPVPHRGRRNDSRNLPWIAARIAEVKGVSPEIVASTAAENGRRLFRI